MNLDDFARGIIKRLQQTPKTNTEIFFDWMRVCRQYESDFTHSFNDEALERNAKQVAWFERNGSSTEHLTVEFLHMQRMRVTWQGICAFLDATTDAELKAADEILDAANAMPTPEFHSKNRYLDHIPPANPLEDFINAGFSSSHPASDTPEYYRFLATFWGMGKDD